MWTLPIFLFAFVFLEPLLIFDLVTWPVQVPLGLIIWGIGEYTGQGLVVAFATWAYTFILSCSIYIA